MIEPGALVLVLTGGQLHVTGRVDELIEGGVWWLDVNVMGTHLPQMYRESEMVEIGPPSSVLAHGICPSCKGLGIVSKFVPHPHDGPCGACGGLGRMALRVGDGEYEIDRVGIACELCAAAMVPYPQS